MALPYGPGRQSYSDHPGASVGLFLHINAIDYKQRENICSCCLWLNDFKVWE
jgi:hypothetical protein